MSFVRQLVRNKMYRQISENGIAEGLKIQKFLGPQSPPRGEQAKLVPSPSPVTLHYSPATTFLNENAAVKVCDQSIR